MIMIISITQGGINMGIFNDNIAKKRINKAKKEFEKFRKPSKHLTKLDIVKSFLTNDNNC